MFGRKKDNVPVPDWEEIKTAVDSIFTGTQKVRDDMSKYLKHFEGEIWDKDELESWNSEASFNMIFSTVENIAPMLTDSKPIVDLVPRYPWMEKAGAAYNQALKYAWDATEMNMVMLKVALSALIMKKGVFKVYYNPMKRYGSDLCIEAIDPRDFFISPGYSDVWEAPMCGMRSKKPVSWVKARFPEAEGVKTSDSLLNEGDSDKKRYFKFDRKVSEAMHVSMVTVYEVWMQDDDSFTDVVTKDQETGEEKTEKVPEFPYGKYVYFTDNEFLGVEPVVDKHGLPPYVTLDDYVHPFNFMGIGEPDQIFGLHVELNKTLQNIFDYSRKHSAPNYAVDTRIMDVEQFRDTAHIGNQVYAKDREGTGVEIIQEAPLNPTVMSLVSLLPQIIEEVSGVTEISKGQATKRERQSASEIAMLLESSHTRTRQRVRNLEWSLKRVAYLLVKLMQQYWDEERPIYWQEKGATNYMQFGSAKDSIQALLRPQPETVQAFEQGTEKNITPEERQEYEDYQEFVRNFSEYGEADPILFDFDIVIQTDSTLPMDKQSRANLALRLWENKLIDREAALTDLGHRDKDKILKRIKEQEQKQSQAKGGKGGAPKFDPTNPQHQELLQRARGGEQ